MEGPPDGRIRRFGGPDTDMDPTLLQIRHFYRSDTFTDPTLLQIRHFYRSDTFTDQTLLQIRHVYESDTFWDHFLRKQHKLTVLYGDAYKGQTLTRISFTNSLVIPLSVLRCSKLPTSFLSTIGMRRHISAQARTVQLSATSTKHKRCSWQDERTQHLKIPRGDSCESCIEFSSPFDLHCLAPETEFLSVP